MEAVFLWRNPKSIGPLSDGLKKHWEVAQHNGKPLSNGVLQLQHYLGSMPRRRYRILVNHTHCVALSNDLGELYQLCWVHLLKVLPAALPPAEQEKWLLAHVAALCQQRKRRSSSPALSRAYSDLSLEDDDEDDDESHSDSDQTEQVARSPPVESPPPLSPLQESSFILARSSSFPLTSDIVHTIEKEDLLQTIEKEDLLQTIEKEGLLHKLSRKLHTTEKEGEVDKEKRNNIPSSKAKGSSTRGKDNSIGNNLRAMFSEDASREERTQRYLIVCNIFAIVYAFLLRYSSNDLFLLLLVLLLGAVSYCVKERRKLIMDAAKRKVRRSARIERKKWLGWWPSSGTPDGSQG